MTAGKNFGLVRRRGSGFKAYLDSRWESFNLLASSFRPILEKLNFSGPEKQRKELTCHVN